MYWKKLIFLLSILSIALGSDDEAVPTSNDSTTAFFLAISMIGVSEIGDKTFLIAALMAMRHPRLLVFSAASSSLAIMTVLAGIIGRTFTSLIPQYYTQFLAGILFLIFGSKLSLEGLAMPKDAGVEEELAEVEGEIAVQDMNKNMHAVEFGGSIFGKKIFIKNFRLNNFLVSVSNIISSIFSPTWIQIFIMVFLGEFGDRSQISTIAMASSGEYWFVILGAILGHTICTGIAVIGGKLLASKISMRNITLSGAFLFFVFGVMYIIDAFSGKS